MITSRIAVIIPLLASGLAGETKVVLEQLPSAVQTAIHQQTQAATLVGLATEKEKGKTVYEVETTVNGKTRDLLLDSSGAVLEVEEETDLQHIPAAARAAIEKTAGGGSIRKVEEVTKGSTVSYEAAIRTKAGKHLEIGVNPDGSAHK